MQNNNTLLMILHVALKHMICTSLHGMFEIVHHGPYDQFYSFSSFKKKNRGEEKKRLSKKRVVWLEVSLET